MKRNPTHTIKTNKHPYATKRYPTHPISQHKQNKIKRTKHLKKHKGITTTKHTKYQNKNKNTTQLPKNPTTYTNILKIKNKNLKQARPTGLAQIKHRKKLDKPTYLQNKKNTNNKTIPPNKRNKKPKNKTQITNPQQKISKSKKYLPQLLLMKNGDIETNPGPMPNLLQTHPNTHKNRCKLYFIPSTIKLQPEYQHLAKQFAPSIKITHPNHQDATIKHPHLSNYIYQNQHHPPPRILYALITTISPSLETCNHIVAQTPTPDWTSILLEKMTKLHNPPERHIQNTHPYTLFTQTNQQLINPPDSINNEIYNFIEENKQNINLNIMKEKFPFLPDQLLKETLKHREPLNEYSHPPQLHNIPMIQTHNTQTTNYNTHLTT